MREASRDFRSWTVEFAVFAAAAVIVHITVGWFTGVYSIVSRYMSLTQAVRLGQAVSSRSHSVRTGADLASGARHLRLPGPRTVVLGGGLATIIVMIAARFPGAFISRRSRDQTNRRSGYSSWAQVRRPICCSGDQAYPVLNAAVAGLLDDRNDLQNMSIRVSRAGARVGRTCRGRNAMSPRSWWPSPRQRRKRSSRSTDSANPPESP